jgi:hypothetical protein
LGARLPEYAHLQQEQHDHLGTRPAPHAGAPPATGNAPARAVFFSTEAEPPQSLRALTINRIGALTIAVRVPTIAVRVLTIAVRVLTIAVRVLINCKGTDNRSKGTDKLQGY